MWAGKAWLYGADLESGVGELEVSGASGDKDHRDIGPKRFTFLADGEDHIGMSRGEAAAPLPADYIWQWDKTREGLGPVVLSNSWKIANCVI